MCVTLGAYVSTLAGNNITLPRFTELSESAVVREQDSPSDRIQRPVITPIMHTDSEQGNDTIKRTGHGSKQSVMNHNLIQLVCVFA